MAKVVLNPALQVLSGDIAGFEYRRQNDGSVVVAKKKLLDPNRELPESQQQQIRKFKEASARYNRLMEQADTRTAYETLLAERGMEKRLRAIVIGDILKAPVVSTIDLSGYQGGPGESIRIIAEDNVGVSSLSLVIYDVTANSKVESSELDISKVAGMVEWVYTTINSLAEGHEVEVRVTAYDLSGNKIEASQPLA